MFSFHFIMLAGMVAWFAWHDWDFPRPKATLGEKEHRGFRYGYRERSQKGRTVALFVAAPVAASWRFALRREDAIDRLAKRVGLAVEMETGDADFDRSFYVDTYDPAVRRLLADGRVRDRVLDLQGRLASLGGRLRRVFCEDGELQVEVTPYRADVARLEREAVNHLALLVELIAEARPSRGETGARERIHHVRLGYLGPWLVGTVIALLVVDFSTVTVLDRTALIDAGAVAGGLAFLVFTLWALRHVGATPRRHRLMLELVLVALPSFFLSAVLAVRTATVHFDTAPAQLATIEEVSLHSRRARRDRQRYSVHFWRAPAGFGEVKKLDLDRATFARLMAVWPEGRGGPATVPLHPGLFGLAWMDGAEVAPR